MKVINVTSIATTKSDDESDLGLLEMVLDAPLSSSGAIGNETPTINKKYQNLIV